MTSEDSEICNQLPPEHHTLWISWQEGNGSNTDKPVDEPNPDHFNDLAQQVADKQASFVTVLSQQHQLRQSSTQSVQGNGMEQSLSQFFGKEGSSLVCARRKGESGVEEALMKRDEVRKRVEKGHVRFLGSGNEGWAAMSSTQVREAVRVGDWEKVEAMVIPEIAGYLKAESLYAS